MRRKTCKESRTNDSNWLEKIELEVNEMLVNNEVEVFLSGRPRVCKFKDYTLVINNEVVSYSCNIE